MNPPEGEHDSAERSRHPGEPRDDDRTRGDDATPDADSGVRSGTDISFVVLVVGGSVEQWTELARALESESKVALVVTWSRPVADVPRLCASFSALSPLAGSVVEPGAVLASRAVHFVAPGAPVELHGDTFIHREFTEGSAVCCCLASSLARDYGARSIALLFEERLPDDGCLFALKASGGFVFATAESAPDYGDEEARPESLDDVADRRFPSEGLARHIAAVVRTASSRSEENTAREEELDGFIVLVRGRTGRDVSVYDRLFLTNTLRRRMNVCAARDAEEYTERFDREPSEQLGLLRELRGRRRALFDDARYWERLERHVLPELVKRAPARPLRLWVPQCGTGEHVYTLVILLREALEAAHENASIQVFAGDLDHESIHVARNRRFTGAELSRLSFERSKRFFVPETDGRYRPAACLRDDVVYATQDVFRDAPFPRLDLIAAYDLFDELCFELRGELSSVFHYALVEDGTLLLRDGAALPQPSNLFARTDSLGVFRARKIPKRLPSAHRARASGRAAAPEHSLRPTIRQQVERLLLEEHAPPAVVIDQRLDILHFFGLIGRYLQPPPGLATVNLLELCPLELRSELRLLLQTASVAGQVVSCEGIWMNIGDLVRALRVTVRPLPNEKNEPLFLVVFEEDGTQQSPAPPSQTRRRTPELEEVESTLRQSPEEIQSIMKACQGAQERLLTRNEALLATNTALLAANAELETETAELQALNDELSRINAEIKERLALICKANADVKNLFESTPVPALFLDASLRVRAFTPAARSFFDVIETDSGRPVSDLMRRFDHPTFEAEAAEVARTRGTKEREVDAADGGRHVMRIFPYVSPDQAQPGVVVTFSDITAPAVVAELGRRALAAGDLLGFLQQALELVKKATGAELCEVIKLNDDKTALDRITGGGVESDVARLEPSSSEDTFALLREREPIVLSPASGVWPAYLTQAGVLSGALVTIWAREDEPFGSLGVYSRTRRDFSKQDLVLLQTIANLFASAIQRKLLEDSRVREREAETTQRAEAQLRRSERLASLGTFAAGIAHELNNPLSNIALAAEYATETKDATRRAKLLANVVSNAQRCGRIVESVLRFARNEETRKWSTDVTPIIRRCVDLAKSYVGHERLSVTLDVPEQSPKIVCNPTEMEQVFTNLLRNAAEAHPARCTVNVRLRTIGGAVKIWLSDDGPGIAPEDRDRIFDPFFSTRRRSGGTGLGLSITHRIVTAHGGSIRVVAEAGPGATFELEFPREGSETKDAESLTGR